MGSFWGMSEAGKEAGGFPREMANWDFQQYKDWLAKQNRYGDLADFYTNNAGTYWTDRQNSGFASPEEITQTGQQISPWVQQWLQEQQRLRQEIRNRESGRPDAATVAGDMSANIDTMGRRVGENYKDIQGEIGDTAGRMFGREDAATGDIINNIKNSSGSQRSAVNDTFGGLRTDSAGTYSGIKGNGKQSFAEQMKNLALIKPGSIAQGARVARSFAPQVADTMQRLIRNGIDPNSPEGAAALRAVETERSRAMDDSQASSVDSYVRQANDVESNKLGFDTAADRARLENEIALGTGQVDRSNQITAKEGDQFNTERRSSTDRMNSIDRDRSDRTVGNTDAAFTRGQDVLNQRIKLSDWQRAAGMEDVDRMNAIASGDINAGLQAGQVQDNQFDRGLTWRGLDQSTRDNAVTNLGQIGNRYSNNMFQSANTANSFGDRAGQYYNQVYQTEAPKAGWGARLLGGIAQAGISLIPGAGPAAMIGKTLGGAAIGAMTGSPGVSPGGYGSGGGGGYGGGTSGYGGGWGGGGNPYSFSYIDPSMYRMPQSQMPQYDPAKTRTLPNGDLQVGTYPTSTQRTRWAA